VYWDLQSYFWDRRLPRSQVEIQTRLMVDALAGCLPEPRARVLDVGCATGTGALALAEAGFSVVGIDFAPRMIERARSKVYTACAGASRLSRWISTRPWRLRAVPLTRLSPLPLCSGLRIFRSF